MSLWFFVSHYPSSLACLGAHPDLSIGNFIADYGVFMTYWLVFNSRLWRLHHSQLRDNQVSIQLNGRDPTLLKSKVVRSMAPPFLKIFEFLKSRNPVARQANHIKVQVPYSGILIKTTPKKGYGSAWNLCIF